MPPKGLRPLFLLLALCWSANALAIGAAWPISDTPRFWILGEGLGHLALDGTYFQSTENYDANGLVTAPATEQNTQLMDVRLHGGFGFAPRLSLYSQVDFRGVTEQLAANGTTASSSSTNTGFGDAFVGFRWLVYRSSPTDRVYPTEWSPRSVVGIIEGTWNFPIYQQAANGTPPIGEQSNDFSGIGRLAWYANDWLAFSAGAGYIYRTAGYAPTVPWNIRVDLSAQQRQKFRFWLGLQAFETWGNSNAVVLNPQQPDAFPNGSLLYKSYAPRIRTAELGAGLLLGREWELVAAADMSVSGVDAAKGVGFGLGLTWRPYQVAEVKYDEYRKRQVEIAQTEKRVYQRKEVKRYGFRATIVKVSARKNYVKIYYGEKDRVRVGDTFYIMPPDSSLTEANPRPVAFATAVQVQPDAAFLHIEERYDRKAEIHEGYETRRVYFENSDD